MAKPIMENQLHRKCPLGDLEPLAFESLEKSSQLAAQMSSPFTLQMTVLIAQADHHASCVVSANQQDVCSHSCMSGKDD